MSLELVRLAYDIIEMQETIQFLRKENERLRGVEKKYNEFLNNCMKNSDVTGAWVNQILKGNIKINVPIEDEPLDP